MTAELEPRCLLWDVNEELLGPSNTPSPSPRPGSRSWLLPKHLLCWSCARSQGTGTMATTPGVKKLPEQREQEKERQALRKPCWVPGAVKGRPV